MVEIGLQKQVFLEMELSEALLDDRSSAASSLLPLASASQQPYVSKLLSFTLDRLHKEPELLRVDAERIKRQMQEVAVGNYRAFISAADALHSVKEEVSSIHKHLDSLITEIPKLNSGCTEFAESGEQILEKRVMNQTLLANHSTLLDLLKIPQLMDTHVIDHVLPECLHIIEYLRRIGVFKEYEMCLQTREMVSCHRTHLFDVVNQYRAIFADDTSGSEENGPCTRSHCTLKL